MSTEFVDAEPDDDPHRPLVNLTDEDGNIFVIGGRVRGALRKAGYPDEAIESFTAELTEAKSYDEALRVVMRWVDVA
jgi:hypothetical protein